MSVSTPPRKPSATKPHGPHVGRSLQRLLRDYASPDAMGRIAIVRRGIPATAVTVLVDALALPKEQVAAGIAIPVPTLNRKLKARTALSPTESERVAGLVQLVSMVERWTAELGDRTPAEFLPMAWLGQWLTTPNPALGDERPLALLDTAEGRTLVGNVLGSLESGAFW